MIDLYFWPTPNGFKITIYCEEVGLPYKIIPVNIGRGDQFQPEFLKISPNNRMPAIIDHDGPGSQPFSLFESGAILIYLGDKTGKLLPKEPRDRYQVMQWLMFQMGGIGPMLGQAHHFRMYAPEKLPYAVDRYTNEARRLYNVMDKQLAQHEYLAGEYSIADIATFPWILPHRMQGLELEEFPNVNRWFRAIRGRPAVEKGLSVMADQINRAPMDEKAKDILFGKTQFEKR
jgi:GSH-dependent disulfide-bond oxidoreductase